MKPNVAYANGPWTTQNPKIFSLQWQKTDIRGKTSVRGRNQQMFGKNDWQVITVVFLIKIHVCHADFTGVKFSSREDMSCITLSCRLPLKWGYFALKTWDSASIFFIYLPVCNQKMCPLFLNTAEKWKGRLKVSGICILQVEGQCERIMNEKEIHF